jgi:mono/diheme cytochrome c family protein
MAKGKFLDLHRHLPSAAFLGLAALLTAAFAGVFVFAGVYNIGADAPHYQPIYMALEKLRDRAIKHHARNIAVPADLNSPARIATGAGLYTEMCTGCHLGPGLEKTEMSQGLYPQAPELARSQDQSAAEQFWTIKHGVKLSAMPAWGRTHEARRQSTRRRLASSKQKSIAAR